MEVSIVKSGHSRQTGGDGGSFRASPNLRHYPLLLLVLAVIIPALFFGACVDPTLPAKYTITFESEGGSVVEPVTADEGTAVAKPADPTRAGYAFTGWFNAASGGTAYTWPHTLTANVSMHAQWRAVATQYTITFESEGGSAVEPVTAGEGTAVAKPADPTRAGYAFTGWFDAASGGTAYMWPHTLTANVSMHAQWQAVATQYTITFESEGGSVVESVTANADAAIPKPADPTRAGYAFTGWFNAASGGTAYTWPHTLTANVSMHAQWEIASMPAGLSLDAALAWISANALEGGAYTIALTANEAIAPKTLSYNGKTVSIILIGGAAEQTVSLASNGSLFTMSSGVTLTLGNNVTLRGRNDNTDALVRVNSGGTLVMENGSKISGNSVSSSGLTYYGAGGVSVDGTFAMNGGEISGNSASASLSAYGGGVYVSGTFTMSGGVISDNIVSDSSITSGGGGVYVSGTFTMSGGVISDNIVSDSSITSGGGGVYVGGGTFTMSGGTISGNIAFSTLKSYGGGVYVDDGTFTMSGGTISSNAVSASAYYSESDGGGVYVSNSSTFTMNGGKISGNTASRGGGLFVSNSGAFAKSGQSTIYGSDASDTLKNTAKTNAGHAVYIVSSPVKVLNVTAGPGVNISSSSPSTVTGITYDEAWALQDDGRRKSPATGHNSQNTARVSFTAQVGASIVIQLDVSSEENCDYVFITTLDSGSDVYLSISGAQTSVTAIIPVPTGGSHFVDIGYWKDGSGSGGSDCAWFKVIE
jgi:uncharacterized repeat protein (TIGR02543 family)